MRTWKVSNTLVETHYKKYELTYTEDDLRESGIDPDDRQQVHFFFQCLWDGDADQADFVCGWDIEPHWEDDIEVEEF